MGVNAKPKPSRNGLAPEPLRIAETALALISPDDLAHATALHRVAHHFGIREETRGSLFASPVWGDIARDTDETRDIARRRDFPREWVRSQAARGADVEMMERALLEAWEIVRECPREPEPEPDSDEPPSFRLNILGAEAFAKTEFRMNWLVRRILVEGQPCVVAAPKKGMKTTTMVDLAVSMATGTPFLGVFDIPAPAPVLFLSGESGGFVLKDTVRRVCEVRGIADWAAAMEGRFFIGFNLPQLSSDEQVAALADAIRENGIRVVMIDPLYLCLVGAASDGKRVDPANLFDMGPLFLTVAKACLEAGATPILIHHFKLTGQTPGAMPELESMAYSGIQEFARQWILMSRRKKFEPGSGVHNLWLTVGGSAGHSGEWGVDVTEGNMADDFTGRTWHVSVRPAAEVLTEEKDGASEQAAARTLAGHRARDDAKAKVVEADAAKALNWLRRKGAATRRAWRDGLGWNSTKFSAAAALLADHGAIEATRVRIKTGTGEREADGVRVAPELSAVRPLEGLQ